MKVKAKTNSNPVTLVIVEDDEVYRESIRDIINEYDLLKCDYAFDSCEKALRLFNSGEVPQVILLDIKLPGMNGIEAIPKFKALSPATHIIMLTVFDDDDNIFNALCHGAEGYLLKTATAQQIFESVQSVMAGGAAMTPTIAAKVIKMFTRYAQPKSEYDLTSREKEILNLLVEGNGKKQVADMLYISLYTVDTHLKNIYSKLHVHSQIDVIAKALKEHLL